MIIHGIVLFLKLFAFIYVYVHACIKYYNRESNLLTINDMPGDLGITLLQ